MSQTQDGHLNQDSNRAEQLGACFYLNMLKQLLPPNKHAALNELFAQSPSMTPQELKLKIISLAKGDMGRATNPASNNDAASIWQYNTLKQQQEQLRQQQQRQLKQVDDVENLIHQLKQFQDQFIVQMQCYRHHQQQRLLQDLQSQIQQQLQLQAQQQQQPQPLLSMQTSGQKNEQMQPRILPTM